MWLRAPTGQGGGAQSPSSEISHEGGQRLQSVPTKEVAKLHYLSPLLCSVQQSFSQLLFLLLLLMVNYRDDVEQRQGRLLHEAVRRSLHSAPRGLRNLTSLRE